MLDVHIARGAALTRGRHRGPGRRESRRFGVLEVDEDSRVTGFQEKPARPRPRPGTRTCCLGSMGIYIFDTDAAGARAAARRRGGDAATTSAGTSSPSWWRRGERVYAYLFWDENKKESKYWRDVGTLDAYYEASMDLIQVDPVFNLYDPEWPLRTYQPQFPPAKFVFDEDGRARPRARLASSRWAASSPAARCSARSSRPDVRVHSYCDDRGLDPDAQRDHPPPRADPARHHRPRRGGAARARDRLRSRRGPAPPHRLRRRGGGGHAGRGVPASTRVAG